MINDRYINDQIARSKLAESVELPIEQWEYILEELVLLRKLALDVHKIVNVTGEAKVLLDAHIQAENIPAVGALMMDAAKIYHRITYADAPNED